MEIEIDEAKEKKIKENKQKDETIGEVESKGDEQQKKEKAKKK